MTSDFGEARPLRYHMGIDFSTHGKIGLPVYAVDNGFIIRVKRSYYGYGNALYLMTHDSLIYVYAHLDRFIPPIEDTLFKLQMYSKRYKQDLYFDDTLFFVKKGDIIGYSGESGVGYPHLHFEKRIGWLLPVFPLEDTLSFSPVLKGIFMETPSANYEIKNIDTHSISLPYAERFKLFLLVSYTKSIRIVHKKDTLFHLSIDTLNYLNQSQSGLLFKPKEGSSFKGFIRTNFDSVFPTVVRKSVREYTLKDESQMKIELVSSFGDTQVYTINFLKSVKLEPFFYYTYDKVPYSFSDYGIQLSEEGKRRGYRFIEFTSDTLVIIGNDELYAEINPRYVPYLRGFFYKTNGDSLFIYPEYPQLLGYIYIRTTDSNKQVYRIQRGKNKYVVRTLRLGAFVSLEDTISPHIRFVGKKDSIAFYVDDYLSGVLPDSMVLLVNNEWYPVYYDFERKVAVLRYELRRGWYNVNLKVLDRAHNVSYWKGRVYLDG